MTDPQYCVTAGAAAAVVLATCAAKHCSPGWCAATAGDPSHRVVLPPLLSQHAAHTSGAPPATERLGSGEGRLLGKELRDGVRQC